MGDFTFSGMVAHLATGIPMTLSLCILALLLGGSIAILINLTRSLPLFSAISDVFVFLFRGTPLLLQIFLIYYGLAAIPFIRESFAWQFLREPYWCALLALLLNDAAYTSEILRGAIKSVPTGLTEAARVAGMSNLKIYRRIILPIAIRNALPAYSSEVVAVLKGTALVSTITLMDVTGLASAAVRSTWRAIEIFSAAAVIYIALSLLITWGFSILERRLSPWMYKNV